MPISFDVKCGGRAMEYAEQFFGGAWKEYGPAVTRAGFARFLRKNVNDRLADSTINKWVSDSGLGERFVHGSESGNRPVWQRVKVQTGRMLKDEILARIALPMEIDTDGLPSFGQEIDCLLSSFYDDQRYFSWATEAHRWQLLRAARLLFDSRIQTYRENFRPEVPYGRP